MSGILGATQPTISSPSSTAFSMIFGRAVSTNQFATLDSHPPSASRAGPMRGAIQSTSSPPSWSAFSYRKGIATSTN